MKKEEIIKCNIKNVVVVICNTTSSSIVIKKIVIDSSNISSSRFVVGSEETRVVVVCGCVFGLSVLGRRGSPFDHLHQKFYCAAHRLFYLSSIQPQKRGNFCPSCMHYQ